MILERKVKWAAKESAAAIAVFVTALEHITTQGRGSFTVLDNGFPSCQYRGPNGLQCAFGPCVRDYSEAYEGRAADVMLHHAPEAIHPWARACPPDFARAVQQCHDIAAREKQNGEEFMPRFLELMESLAHRYPELELEVPQ